MVRQLPWSAAGAEREAAWRRFLGGYRAPLFRLCRAMGLRADEVSEVESAVWLKVGTGVHAYRRDRAAFRTWFSALVYREIQTFCWPGGSATGAFG
jgi:hypothetical protein